MSRCYEVSYAPVEPKLIFRPSFTAVTTREQRTRLVENILQYCVEPRARLSLPDAVFAYQMVKRLHSMNTAGFHTIVFFDQVRLSHLLSEGPKLILK